MARDLLVARDSRVAQVVLAFPAVQDSLAARVVRGVRAPQAVPGSPVVLVFPAAQDPQDLWAAQVFRVVRDL